MMRDYIQPDWPAPDNVHAFSTTRAGGYSQPPFDQFNLGFSVEDDRAAVEKNRALLESDLTLPASPLWLHQVHGTRVINATDYQPGEKADACFTTEENKICIVMTADCLPVLLCDSKGTKVAAVHAGWRGLSGGILTEALQKFNRPASEILAWLGPAIGQQAYEVDAPVYEAFLQRDPATKKAFIPVKEKAGHWYMSLYKLARLELAHQGVTHWYGGQACTYADAQRFYSWRREGRNSGRMATFIWRTEASHE